MKLTNDILLEMFSIRKVKSFVSVTQSVNRHQTRCFILNQLVISIGILHFNSEVIIF